MGDALTTHGLALTHHAWPIHYSGATTKSSTTKCPQRQRSRSASAEARTRQQHGHSETQSCSSSNSGSSAKTSPPWLMFHRLPSVLNRLASMLRAVSSVVSIDERAK